MKVQIINKHYSLSSAEKITYSVGNKCGQIVKQTIRLVNFFNSFVKKIKLQNKDETIIKNSVFLMDLLLS